MTAACDYPDMFNDVFGPVMQPGSSSHLAGPCRLGFIAFHLLGEHPPTIRVILDKDSSMAGSFGVMAEDNAMLAGAMGMLPDNPELFHAAKIAGEKGIKVDFIFSDMKESRHPNAMKFELASSSGRTVSLVGDSLGSGMIETRYMNDFPLAFRGDSFLLLVFHAGLESENFCAARIEQFAGNSISDGIVRHDRGTLYFARLSVCPDVEAIKEAMPDCRVVCIPPVVAVPERPARGEPLFRTFEEWMSLSRTLKKEPWEIAVEYEMRSSGWSFDDVFSCMRSIAGAMHRQTHAIYRDSRMDEFVPYKYDYARQWAEYRRTPRRVLDDLTTEIVGLVYGACSCIPGVPTVPGPMGGGGGYLYAALRPVAERKGLSPDEIVKSLFVAGGIAVVAMTRTEPTGEKLGCSGECGTCGAMAAAALVSMAGGTGEEMGTAASLLLQSCLGVPCDPIPGGAGQPCRTRIMSACCMAPVFADMSMAGHKALLSLSEAFDALDRVGRGLPEDLLCNSKGGCAVAPSALSRAEEYRNWVNDSIVRSEPRPPVF